MERAVGKLHKLKLRGETRRGRAGKNKSGAEKKKIVSITEQVCALLFGTPV
jgi:hypothetical protein